jgi:hypothetical protein
MRALKTQDQLNKLFDCCDDAGSSNMIWLTQQRIEHLKEDVNGLY